MKNKKNEAKKKGKIKLNAKKFEMLLLNVKLDLIIAINLFFQQILCT